MLISPLSDLFNLWTSFVTAYKYMFFQKIMAGVESKMERWLHCPICQDTVKKPKTLTCFHSFCDGCVRQLTKTSHTEKPGVNCPVCRAFTEDSMVKTNFLVHELLETHEGMSLNLFQIRVTMHA